jgi:molybdenum cofactor cytidylyltransferase
MKYICAIVLAAGESKRMKVPKMLLPYKDKTIIEKVIENIIASGIEKIIVVLGSDKDNIRKVTGNLPVTNCYNDNYREGMLSSVKCGFSKLDEQCGAVLVFLGDQPGIEADVIKNLIKAYRNSDKGIVIPVFNNKRGHPLIIDIKYKGDIEHLDKSATLRDLVHKHAGDVHEIEVETQSILRDIDTHEDYLNELKQID